MDKNKLDMKELSLDDLESVIGGAVNCPVWCCPKCCYKIPSQMRTSAALIRQHQESHNKLGESN